ncbi:MAG: YueH family protein [Heyndrickxia sp.]
MKIRKTTILEKQEDLYIYENKKDEYFVVAVPVLEWSTYFTYDDDKEELLRRLSKSLQEKVGRDTSATELATKIYGWTREM